MKRFLLIATGLALGVVVVFLVVSWIAPGWVFDISQRIKYREYYAWRDSGSTFPEKQFWIGFNTDRHKRNIFIGKTREEIERALPLVQPVSPGDSLLQGYIASRKISSDNFAMISGSMWILEFDKNNRCVDIKMPKG